MYTPMFTIRECDIINKLKKNEVKIIIDAVERECANAYRDGRDEAGGGNS